MRFLPSPYFVTKDILVVEKMVRVDRLEVKQFRWWKMILNLTGLEKYDFSLPWMYKARVDDPIVTDVCRYKDDGQSNTNTV